MITKLVNSITEYFNGVEVHSSDTTESKYLNANGVKIRISDHYSDKIKQYPIQIIIPKTPKHFIIVCGYNTFVYSSFNKTKDFIINYILSRISLAPVEENRIANQTETIQRLQETIDTLKQKVDTLSELEVKHKRQTEELQHLQEIQSALKGDIKSKDRDLKEAAELIEKLNTPEYREMIYNNKTDKKYYLDNFPKETREFIESLIKTDYDRL